MMRSVRRLVGVCIAVLGMCFSSWSFASDVRPDIVTALSFATEHGAEAAKFRAELAVGFGFSSLTGTVTGSLISESNGYRLAELVNSNADLSEVAKGKTGVGAGALA